MRMGKRILSALLSLVMATSLVTTSVGAAGWTDTAAQEQWVRPEYTDAVDTTNADNVVELSGGNWTLAQDEATQLEEGGDLHASTDMVEVIVVMEEQPLIKEAVEAGLAGDMPAYLTMSSTVSLEKAMLRSHDAARAEIAALCGDQADTDGYDYTTVLNGFSMTMPYGKIAEAEALPGVKYIRESRTYNVPEDQSSYDLAMSNSTGMIGSDVVNDMRFAGADGAGTLVAILDTGIAKDHEAFSVEPKNLSAAVYGTEADLQAVMSSAKLSSGLTDASDAWISAKIPYAYNYADMTTGGYSSAQPHGTHVAGTVAGNNGKGFLGVAPEAQLLVMKVFGESGTTSDAALNAGLDDAVKLGADSINMSLGSTAGFYYTREIEEESYNNCWDAGVNLLIAAGNEYTNALGNQYGNNLGLADTPDNASVAAPSTSYSALSVASVNNCKSRSDYFLQGEEGSGEHIPFSQAGNASTRNNYNIFDELRAFPDNTASFEYVVIGGYGEEADYVAAGYAAADALQGKVAVVNRGSTSFETKATVAKNHGAKAVIFVNNVAKAGAFSPAFNNYVLPSCGVSLESGEILKNAEEKTVTFGPSETSMWYGNVAAEDKIPWVDFFEASDGYQMSSFSSWGPAPNLAIKPEISAPGGNIVSAVIGGGYESYSGTSMATPHMAGAAALVRSYVKSLDITDDPQEIRTLTENLMMSTAVPAINSAGAEFSPREQGAGLVNVENVVNTKAYLSTAADADGVTRPKAELGSNANGSFAFSFYVNNLSDEDLTYTLSASSLTEGITEQYGVKFSDQLSTRLDSDDFTVSYSGSTVENGVVTVPAGKTVTVNVDIQLSAEYRSELYDNFENGNFCEGYIYLQPADGVELVIPYLGFVGDWVTAGTTFEGDPSSDYSLAPTIFATVNLTGAGLFLGEDAVYTGPKSYNYDRLAFSPKIAGEQQFLAMQLGIRRNVMDFEVSISDEEGNKVWSLGADYLRKCYYNTNTGSVSQAQILTDGWNGRYQDPETGEYTGDYAPAGQYYLTLEGYVGQQSDVKTSKTYPIWLDGSAPEVSNLQCYVDENDRNENGEGKFKLAFDVKDDHFVRTVIVNDSTGTWRLTYSDADFKNHSIQQGETTKVVMDLDELCQYLADNGLNPGRIKLQISDYSLNYRVVYVDLGPQYLNVANATVAVGDSLQMEYRVLPMRLADTLKLAWTSSDETIATVDENGVVTGVAKGQCYITAKAESGLSATATLTVGDETLPPEQPEMPDNNAPVDYPSPEVMPDIWDNGVTASAAEELNERFEADGLWYKVTGADTVQLIRNPGAANDYANPYPEIPAELVIPETVTNSETGKTYTVTTIGYRALYMVSHLTSITLPDTIRVIGDQAFLTGWVSKVTSMNLPEGLEEVGANAMNGIKVDFQLPSTLKRIGTLAFNATSITRVHLGENVESVGARAFANCTSLKEANLTRNTQNTEGIYMNCTALTDVTIDPDVTLLPQTAFYNCQSLTDLDLPESVVEIGKGTFQGCHFESLDFLNTGSVKTLNGFALAGNPLKNIVIPDSVTYVGEQQFRFCSGVRSITFGKNVAYVGLGVMSMFFADPEVGQVIPEVGSATAGAAVRRSGYVGAMTRDGVNFDVYCGTAFMQDGFNYMPISATEVQVTGYDESVVSGVVTIPETVTCEGDEVTYTVTSISDNLFKLKYNITEIHLPDTIKTVGQRSFDQLHELSYINIPTRLERLTGDQSFGYGGWDPLVEHDAWKVDTLVVPETLKTWAQSAFAGNQYTKVVLSDGLQMVGQYAFAANIDLTEIEMPSSLQYLKEYAFTNCTALENVTLPDGLLYIGDKVFQGDPLQSITLPGSVQYVGTQAFETMKYDYSSGSTQATYAGPAEITLGGGVTGLGWNAFYKDAKLTAILGSQQNLLVERCDFTETPDVVWDGKTSIPAGDWSRVPAGTTVTVSGSVRIDGTLIIEDGAKVEVAPGGRLNIGMDAEVDQSKISWIYVPTVPAEPEQPAFRFEDVQDENAFYFAPVYWAVEQGITNGVTEDLFQPNGTCTRGQAVTFLWRAAGSPEPKGSTMPFTDVASGSYCEKAVLWAVENGITNGTTETTFSPNAGCTRAQIVALICRSQQGTPAAGDLPFTDAPAWAYDAIAWSYQQGIVKGTTETTFSPNALCTRGQIVTFLYRALSK